MLMLAAMSPEELLVEKLTEMLQKYSLGTCKLDDLAVACNMIVLKTIVGEDVSKVVDMMKDVEKVSATLDLTRTPHGN